MKSAIVLAILPLLALAAEPTAKPAVTLRGSHSRIEKPEHHRILTQQDLSALWLRHLGKDPAQYAEHYNEAGVPEVDFEKCMVIAIFGGKSWNCAGYSADSIREEEATITLRYSPISYQTLDTSDAVTPFAFMVVARSNKEYVLEVDARSLINEPPVWRETARFAAIKG